MSKRFQFTPALARVSIGLTGTASVMSAGVFIFLPFSDLRTLQLAACPHATSASTSAPTPLGLAHTGRSWGAAAQRRQEAAASAPLARVARREELSVP